MEAVARDLHEELANDLLRLERNTQKILLRVLNSVAAEQVERIHDQGKAANGSKIGSYSTEPASVSRKTQVRNTGKTFFQGGYKEYKQKSGQQANFVTLENTGQMRQDYSVIPIGSKSAALGFKNTVNGDKSDWMEDKYNKVIYDETKKEEELFDRLFDHEVSKFI